MGFTSDGPRSLANDLRAAGDKAGPLISLATRKTGADVERDAKTLAAVDTGNLRSSIGSDTIETDTSIAVEIGPTADYGLFVEVGTSRMPPKPFMNPAFDRHTASYEAALGQVMDKIL